MESEGDKLKSESKEKVFQIFKDFCMRIAKLEELGAVGSRLLNGFQEGLEYLRRPPINQTSELIQNIIKANETKRVKSYIEADCINSHDRIQNMSKCKEVNTCLLGLHDYLSKAKSILNELEHLMEELAAGIRIANGCLSPEETASSSSDPRELGMTDHASLMGIIYSMVKQDYMMQVRIVSSLNLKSISGELESYCLMWSLRPFINDEIMHEAWRLVSQPVHVS